MIDIILTIVSVLAASFVWYRLGRQSVIDDLFKAYEYECKLNQCNVILIERLRNELKKYEEVTNEVETSKEAHERL